MPPRRTSQKVYELAHDLRKKPTPAEKKLWAYLRGNKLSGVNFRRQCTIGCCVPDFCAINEKLVIELDRSHHLEKEKYEEERTRYFESRRYQVIRFWNNEVINNIESVILGINYALEARS